MATVDETLDHINKTLKSINEGPYKNYSCKTVSWDDVQRGNVGGSLSCWGSNITDTRLYAKDGRSLFTVRGDNWNERLGKVSHDDLMLIADDGDTRDGIANSNYTLREILNRIDEFGSYVGLDANYKLSDEILDKEVSIRFQTTFLPVEEGEKSTLEFAPEAYNYNTTDDEDPRNLILLCTSQGLSIQQDGKGAKKLYHHGIDYESQKIERYWFEAESTKHRVGGQQNETEEERQEALSRGKATALHIGTKHMGKRFNVLMTIQVPLEQKKKKPENHDLEFDSFGYGGSGPMFKCATACAYSSFPEDYEEYDEVDYVTDISGGWCLASSCSEDEPEIKLGKSSAARVSRGSKVEGEWNNGILSVQDPKRHPSEHITATIVIYNTCSGGVPTEEDVKAAIDDLEELYRSVEYGGVLADDKFNFMKSELTVKDVMDINTKIITQPPVSVPQEAII